MVPHPGRMKRTTGQYVQIGSGDDAFRAFVPAPLPPAPPLKLTAADLDLLEQANRALGKLDGITSLLPNTSLFIYAYVRKEALVSSQIEGTQSSLSDLLLYESHQAPGVPLEDVREVSDYVAALDHGIERLRGGFPLSLRLLREIHGVLLRGGRGSHKTPGEFRRSQVDVPQIGGFQIASQQVSSIQPDALQERPGCLETDQGLVIVIQFLESFDAASTAAFSLRGINYLPCLIMFLFAAVAGFREIENHRHQNGKNLHIFQHFQECPPA